jgi:hypothetical protein
MALSGEFTVVHALPPPGNPRKVADALIAASDGNLWGLWDDGLNSSVMYRVSTEGVFPLPVELGIAGAGLVEATDALFHGSSYSRSGDVGSRLFRASPSGTFTLDYTFPTANFVAGPLMQASDGELYGSLNRDPRRRAGRDLSIQPDRLGDDRASVHARRRPEPDQRADGTPVGIPRGSHLRQSLWFPVNLRDGLQRDDRRHAHHTAPIQRDGRQAPVRKTPARK